MKKATIYTGRGDSGTTSLTGGTRVPKNHPRVEAYGTLDELNACIGLLSAAIENPCLRETLAGISNSIISLCGYLADERECRCPIENGIVSKLEEEIDALESTLPPMHEFILPSGNETAARANLCRTVCRRAERNMAALQQQCTIEVPAMVFINRLSDYFFMLQRLLCNGEEKIWQKPCI